MTGRRRRWNAQCRRGIATLASVVACLAADASPAVAGSPIVTEQSQAADAAFLGYAPAPSDGAGSLCLVDTGVHPNPDTTPGLVYTTATDGGSGNDDADPQGHGTTMAMTAGGAGNGLRGAWPQLKIVSVRATTQPPPGQEPTFEFDDYATAMRICLREASTYHIDAIDLALSSEIPPTPDQAATLANEVAQAEAQNIAIVAAAGNSPGPAQQPGAQAGIFAVGAGDPTNGVCSFSANQGLTLYAPGCNLDMADPFTDEYEPQLGGAGTSQASAFTAAVIVALMSYDPTLTAARVDQLLVQTANASYLDVAAAFQADGLGQIVAQGNAAIPQPPPAPSTSAAATAPNSTAAPSSTTTPSGTAAPNSAATPSSTAVAAASVLSTPSLVRWSWKKGLLKLSVIGLPAKARLHARLVYLRHPAWVLVMDGATLRVRCARPQRVVLSVTRGAMTTASVTIRTA